MLCRCLLVKRRKSAQKSIDDDAELVLELFFDGDLHSHAVPSGHSAQTCDAANPSIAIPTAPDSSSCGMAPEPDLNAFAMKT